MLKNMETKFVRYLKKSLEWLFYAFIFLLPWQTKLIIRPADNNINEISLYGSHLLLLLILIFFFVYKLREKNAQEKVSALWIALFSSGIFILISFFFAPDQVLSFFHYFLYLVGIGLFFMLREGIRPTGYEDCCLDKMKIIYSFLFSIFLQALLGIYQFLAQNSFSCKYFGLAEHNPGVLGTSVVEAASGRWLRAYGGFDHPNIFGGVLAICLILASYLLARKKILKSRQEVAESVFLFLFYFAALFALFFTFSRSSWIAYGLGLILLLGTLIIQRDRWAIGRFLALIFFSIIMTLIIAVPYKDLLEVRVNGDTRLEQKSLEERIEYSFQSKKLIEDNAFFGVGVGNYVAALERQDQSSRESWEYQPVHNFFLLLWAQSGIGALISFFVFLVLLIIKKDRYGALPVAIFGAVIVLMLFDHWLLSLPFGILFLFLILGLL